jgi:hypothetical protein
MSRAALLGCTALALVFGAVAAQAGDVFDPDLQGCNRGKVGYLGCAGPAHPDIIAALKKRYPDAVDDQIWAFETLKNGKYHYGVSFSTAKSEMYCRLTLNPIRFSKCGPRHA